MDEACTEVKADHVCDYRLRGGDKPHSQVIPPLSHARVWSWSQAAAGRPHPGAVHRALRAMTR
jgi:hypothetical protein